MLTLFARFSMVTTKGNIGLAHLDTVKNGASAGWGWFFGESVLHLVSPSGNVDSS